MQSFSPQLITSGASGYLREKFCELELLDEITKLRYEGQLPDHIQGKVRNSLIRAYQTWKGTNYVPELTHPALKWPAKDPLPLLPVVTDAPWQIIEKKLANKKKKQTGDIEDEDDAPEVQSGLLTQSFGHEGSRKLINTISSHCLLVSKNILMDRPVSKLLEILSGMSCIHKILHNFLMAQEAQVLQP